LKTVNNSSIVSNQFFGQQFIHPCDGELDIFLFLKTMICNSAFPFVIKFFSLQIYKKYDFDLQRIFHAKNGPNSLDYKATTVPKPNFYAIIKQVAKNIKGF
jgi:hypothetical protein